MKKPVKLISILLVFVLSVMALPSCGLIDYVIGMGDGEKNDHTHSYVWVIDVEPTYTSEGIKHMECEECGYKSKENTVIEKLVNVENNEENNEENNKENSEEDEEIEQILADIPPLPSGGKHRRFDDCLELAGFCNQVKDSLEGRFLYLDLTPALEEGRISDSFYNYWDSYSLHYKESEEGMYIDSRMSSEIKFYAEELGTDTDINMDVPNHSMTLELISLPQNGIDGDLRYEFYSYDSDKYMRDNIVKIYSGNVLVAYMIYFTGLDISQEWLISFLNDYLVKI